VSLIRRNAWLLFFCDGTDQLNALSLAAGTRVAITRDELDALLAVPSDDWIDDAELDPALVQRLLDGGLLSVDGDEALRDSGWNLYAAAYHFLTRWKGVDIRGADGTVAIPTEQVIEAFVVAQGTPPPAFYRTGSASIELPVVQPDGAVYRMLAARRTTRSFDPSKPLAVDEFALALHQAFGCHGSASTPGGELVSLKRTSPSAGGLHPIEAYPLVTNVDGVEPGLYHYDGELHALELLEPLDGDAARALATQFVCGQTYFGDAHVLFLLVARFNRSYWKYRRHQKAYASILLDAGHLSQTLYLVAADLGLGAFVTTVINNAEIDERLGLDGVDLGTVAVCGLGVSAGRSPFDPVYQPFTSARA
jgi:putative peptide maturation dehydrogenase